MRVCVPVKYLSTKSCSQADRVENLRAAIGLIGRDAHLGHHLQQALVDRLDVALDDLLLVELLRQVVLHRDQRLEGEIGVDRLGAVAGEAGEVMHLARLAGFHHQADRGAQALADQMMMHGRAGEQRRDRNAVGAGLAVRQDDDVAAAGAPLPRRARTAASSAQPMPSAPCSAGKVMSKVQRLEMIAAHLARSSGSSPGPRW